MSTTLILGIGNTLLSDEGIGIHVIDHLMTNHPELRDITCLDGGTLSFTLAGPIAEHDNLIVIDAAQLGAPAGTVQAFVDGQMDRYLTGNRQSVHEVGLTDLLDIARLSETCPKQLALIGIQPKFIDWGEELTPEVARAVDEAAAIALRLHQEWQES